MKRQTLINNARIAIKEKNFQNAINDLTEILNETPDDVEASLLRGESYVKTGVFKNAILDFEKAFSNPSTIGTLLTYYYYCQALYHFGNYDKAIDQVEMILDAYKNDPDAISLTGLFNKMHGELMLRKDDFERATDSFSKALLAESHDIDMIYMRAQAYYRLEKYTEAIMDFKAALMLKSDPGIHLNLGICYFNSGKRAEGIEE